MDLLSRSEIKNLVKKNSYPCISVYMSTHKKWNGLEQDMIRFKNLLNKVEKDLLERNFRSTQTDKLLLPAKNLLDERDFWNHQSNGLAVFIDEDEFKVFRLPVNFEEEATINTRYYIKPLLKVLSGDGSFFLLALDLNEVKLYHGTHFSISELKLPYNTPVSLKEVLKYDEAENILQFHSGTGQVSAGGLGGGHSAVVFHGQGSSSMDDAVYKEKILEFFHMLNKGVYNILKDENSPLILGGVEFLLPIYKKANSYSHLIEKGLDVNTEYLSLNELHKHSWEIVEPVFTEKQRKAVSMYERFSGNGKASSNLEDVVKAAFSKRIESLFINQRERRWGTFNPEKDEVNFYDNNQPGSEDLLDFAAVHTFLNNGTVYVVEKEKMPCDKAAAAVFRY